jgi:GNAT superfamily N-acetyltransferase
MYYKEHFSLEIKNKLTSFFKKIVKDEVFIMFFIDEDPRGEVCICFEIKCKGNTIAKFSLDSLQGCNGVLISHDLYVHPDFRGKGIASFFQKIKEEIAKEGNFSKLIATVNSTNCVEIHILEKYGWKRISFFVNKRTGNLVSVYEKDL